MRNILHSLINHFFNKVLPHSVKRDFFLFVYTLDIQRQQESKVLIKLISLGTTQIHTNTHNTPTHNTQHTNTHNTTTHNTQHTTHNTQHTTQQHTTHNTQHTTHNTQHTTHNTQHNTHTHTQRERETNTHTQRERDTQTQTRHTDTQTHRHTDTQTETGIPRPLRSMGRSIPFFRSDLMGVVDTRAKSSSTWSSTIGNLTSCQHIRVVINKQTFATVLAKVTLMTPKSIVE